MSKDRKRSGLLASAAKGPGRGGLAVVRHCGTHLARTDRSLFAAVLAHRRPAIVTAARAVSGLAEPGIVYPALAAARRGGWPQAVLPGLVVAGGAAARRQLAQVIARPRPPASAWLAEPEGFSLPSRHTTLAALAAGATARALGTGRPSRRTAPLLAAAGVGASRVCLGVHWPGDVVAGWLFAETWLLLADILSPACPGPGSTGTQNYRKGIAPCRFIACFSTSPNRRMAPQSSGSSRPSSPT